MNKILKRNKKKFSRLIKQRRNSGFESLLDYKSLLNTLAQSKQCSRVVKKSQLILDFDNVKIFLKSMYLVPVLYRLPNGKIKSFGGKRMFSSIEDIEKEKNKL